MPKKYAVLSLQQQAIITAGTLLFESSKGMMKYANLHEIDPQLKIAKIMSLVQEVRQYFNSIIPRHFQSKISLFCLKTLVSEKGYKHQNYSSDHLVELLAETMLNITDLSYVAFCNFPFNVDETLCKHLPCMHKVQYLDITQYHAEIPRFAELFNLGLLNMPNLLEFLFEKCTDSIIERIALSCKRIRKIDVTHSLEVTNACIPALYLCEELQEFHFFYTCITRRGYEELLIHHPRLHIFDLIYLVDYVDSDEHYFESSKIFMEDGTLNIGNVRELSSMRPHINCLRITLEEHNYMSIFRWFPNVQKGQIMLYDLQRNFDDFHDALKVRGSTITSLYFDRPVIDINTLFIINLYCPNIRKLSFSRARIEDTALIPELRSERFKPFQSMLCISVSITCSHTVATEQFIKNLLSYSINVKTLFVKGIEFDDKVLEEILVLNPMKQLRQLRLVETHLTMKSVDLLMEHCDNLSHLTNLESWNIRYEELINFMLYLKWNNIQLVITHDKDKDMDKIQNALDALNS